MQFKAIERGPNTGHFFTGPFATKAGMNRIAMNAISSQPQWLPMIMWEEPISEGGGGDGPETEIQTTPKIHRLPEGGK